MLIKSDMSKDKKDLYSRLKNYIDSLLTEGVEGLDLDETAFMRRVNAFLLVAGVNLIILSWLLYALFVFDVSQYHNVVYTGLSGVFILLFRKFLTT